MEIKKWTYEEYPEFGMEGIEVIDSTGDEVAVRYINDVEYCNIDGTALHLQIMIPASRNDPMGTYPCFVYVQGSGWKKQDIHAGVPLVSKMAERGYVCAIVEYRHSGIAAFPACVIDARNAVRFLRKNAEKYQIDPDRIILAGSSSGGHTAVFGGMRHNDGTEENLFPGVSAEVSGIVDYYGAVSVMREDANPTTLNHLMADSPEGMEAGHINLREHPDIRKAMSAECNIDHDTRIPPVLIFHGTKDRTVNPAQSGDLYAKLKNTGHEAYFYLIKGADHGRAEFWTPAVIDKADAFMKKCFGE
jgi:acetyl esterase/lipase